MEPCKKKENFNKLIEATSCGETVILVRNCAASNLFLGNSGSCSGLHNLPIGGKEKGENHVVLIQQQRLSQTICKNKSQAMSVTQEAWQLDQKPAGQPGDKDFISKDLGPIPEGLRIIDRQKWGGGDGVVVIGWGGGFPNLFPQLLHDPQVWLR